MRQLLLVHPDAVVVDDDGGAAVALLEGDADGQFLVRVVQCVGQQLGDGDRDRLDGTGDHGDRVAQLVGDLDALVAAQPGGGADDQFGQVRVLAGQAGPGAAHHTGGLNAPQRLLVEEVGGEQVLGDVRVVVAVLHALELGLELVQQRLDGGGGAPQRGLGGGVDPLALLRHGLGDLLQHRAQRLIGLRPGEPGVQQPPYGHMRMRQRQGEVGEPGPRQVSDLGLGRPQPGRQLRIGVQRSGVLLLSGAETLLQGGAVHPRAGHKRREYDGGGRSSAEAPQQRLGYGCHRDPRVGEGDRRRATAVCSPIITRCYRGPDVL